MVLLVRIVNLCSKLPVVLREGFQLLFPVPKACGVRWLNHRSQTSRHDGVLLVDCPLNERASRFADAFLAIFELIQLHCNQSEIS